MNQGTNGTKAPVSSAVNPMAIAAIAAASAPSWTARAVPIAWAAKPKVKLCTNGLCTRISLNRAPAINTPDIPVNAAEIAAKDPIPPIASLAGIDTGMVADFAAIEEMMVLLPPNAQAISAVDIIATILPTISAATKGHHNLLIVGICIYNGIAIATVAGPINNCMPLVDCAYGS